MVNKNKKLEQYKQKILSIIEEILPQCKIILFGSRARQTHDQGADIDIALDTGKPIDKHKLYMIKEMIEETTIPLMVDVVDLYSASDKFKKEVKIDGIIWKN